MEKFVLASPEEFGLEPTELEKFTEERRTFILNAAWNIRAIYITWYKAEIAEYKRDRRFVPLDIVHHAEESAGIVTHLCRELLKQLDVVNETEFGVIVKALEHSRAQLRAGIEAHSSPEGGKMPPRQ